jgi:flagellar basal body-associated protein FliL
MATPDPKDKAAETPPEAEPKKGKGSGRGKLLVLGGVVIVALGGSFVAGGLVAPKLLPSVLHKGPAAAAPAEKEEPPAPATAVLESIVVDIRDKDGERHHLKVAIALEFNKEIHEGDFKKLEPRARDAAIGYLRTLTLEQANDPARYEETRAALTERLAKAIGKSQLRRILFTEYVSQ